MVKETILLNLIYIYNRRFKFIKIVSSLYLVSNNSILLFQNHFNEIYVIALINWVISETKYIDSLINLILGS